MLNLCAWCGTEINSTETDLHLVSHGICDKCKSNIDFQHGGPLEKFIDTLATPVLVIDGDCNVQMANQRALEILGKTPETIRGFKPGVVFECAYARLPGGCGKTVHCSGCSIRNTVTGTMNTGASVNKFPAYLNRTPKDSINGMDLLISTIKSGSFVLLKVDDIKPSQRKSDQ